LISALRSSTLPASTSEPNPPFRLGHKKAIVALAHKMIRLIYLLLTRRQPYIDPHIDYAAISARKNAPRWIRQLALIGQWPAAKTPAAAAAT